MSAHPRPLEPHQSAQHFFGAELRCRRIEARLSLTAMADRVFVTAELLRKVEVAMRFPSLDLAQRSDIILDADGALTRLYAFAVAERDRQRQQRRASVPGLEASETVQLRRLLAAINLVTAAQTATSNVDLLDWIDGVLPTVQANRSILARRPR